MNIKNAYQDNGAGTVEFAIVRASALDEQKTAREANAKLTLNIRHKVQLYKIYVDA